MAYGPEYEQRVKALSRQPKIDLMIRAAELGHFGFTSGLHGLGGWTSDELRAAILDSEFPQEASNG